MIVSDLDRTLLNSEGKLTEFTKRVLRDLRSHGTIIAIATARPPSAAKQVLEGLHIDALICLNGALIEAAGNRQQVGIEVDEATDLCHRILRSHPGARIAIEMNDCRYANFDTATLWPGADYVLSDFTDLPRETADKVLVPIQDVQEQNIREMLSEYLRLDVAEGWLGMVMNRAATKEGGVAYLADLFGTDLNSVAAFGDDLIDIGMLQAVGIGVAVANANPLVIDAAGDVCESNDNDGVARWLLKTTLESAEPSSNTKQLASA